MHKPVLIFFLSLTTIVSAAENELRVQTEAALRRGVEFFRNEIAVQGTYLWQYSEDLSKREGEGVASSTQGWVQPPGTPAVGLAYLAAWRATSNSYYLKAARETAYGLIRGQLRSGGWTYAIDFSPEGRRKAAYRHDGKKNARNVTTLDDDTTQCALRFLMQTDIALRHQDSEIRESIAYALDALLKAQYPNGAWPQGFDAPAVAENFPVKKASYPESWPRVWPGNQQYWSRYTLNDNSLATTVNTLLDANWIYHEKSVGADFNALAEKCRKAALAAGEFLLRAQLPEPQPAWAQQYDFDMHPAWARKFEPPSITGGESRHVLRLLLTLYRETGERRFLEPVPRALEYFRKSKLPDGRLARFYELQSNKPLYFTKKYELTYEDDDLPTHYAFKVSDWTESVAREYEQTLRMPAGKLKSSRNDDPPTLTPGLVAEVKSIIAAQDERGRWVEGGGLSYHRPKDESVRVIKSATFNRNVETLSRFLQATRR